MKPKIITLDIETSPLVVYTWGIWQQNVGLNQIIRDWNILSYCAKTLGDDEIRYADVSEHGKFTNLGLEFDDRALLLAIRRELDEADIVVTQNGARFDHRKINARFLTEDIAPPSPFRIVDTKVEASKIAMFTSNRLEWLADVVAGVKKDKHTDFPGFDLWSECLKGNPAAWASMRKYNPQDVIATEKLYLKLRPWIKGHPNVAAYTDDEEPACPRCGSRHIIRKGTRITNAGEYPRYKCGDCGGWSHGRFTTNTIAKRKRLLGTSE